MKYFILCFAVGIIVAALTPGGWVGFFCGREFGSDSRRLAITEFSSMENSQRVFFCPARGQNPSFWRNEI